MVWYSHLFKNFPQFVVLHTIKGFGIVNKAEIDVFLELSCFFYDSMDVGNLISGSSAFSKSSLNMWKFLVQLSSGHRPGKGQFSFQSQRKAMPTTPQLHSSHTLAKECSKFSKPGFSNMWSLNFQMFKLDLEKAEEPEVKLPTSTGIHQKSKRVLEKYLFLLYWLCQSLWQCGSQQTVENS